MSLLCFCLQVFIGRAVAVLLKSSCDQFDIKNVPTKAKLKENDATVRLRVVLLAHVQPTSVTSHQSDLYKVLVAAQSGIFVSFVELW